MIPNVLNFWIWSGLFSLGTIWSDLQHFKAGHEVFTHCSIGSVPTFECLSSSTLVFKCEKTQFPQKKLQQVFPLWYLCSALNWVWDSLGALFWGSNSDGNFAYVQYHVKEWRGTYRLHRKFAPLSGLDVPDQGEHLHFLELCAGAHRLTDAATDYGYSALAMDVPSLNTHIENGFNQISYKAVLFWSCLNHIV